MRRTKNTRRANLRLEVLEDRSVPATFTVANTGDNGGVNPAPFAGTGTLRQAIVDANEMAGADTIAFAIGSGAQTIRPTSLLPFVTDPVVLDATTQPGYAGKPLIELDGSLIATGCLILTGGNSTVRGFAINRFTSTEGPTVGIAVLGEGAGGNVIEKNYIGTNLAGTGVFGPDQRISYGVIVRNDGNVIRDNVISGNGAGGVLLQNVGQGDSTNNLITNNLIGTDWTGTVDLGNTLYGVFFINAGNANRIEGNVISGNDAGGMFLDSDSNLVRGNKVGVAANGSTPLGNGLGMWIAGGNNNTIGGTTSGAGNVIAFNKSWGVFMGPDTVGNNGTGNAVRGNSIHGNGLLGINLFSPNDPPNGVTPNDTGDADSGPNNLQNFPVIQSALALPGVLVATVSLNSRPNTTYVIDFYASAAADPSGHGEGQRYLGSKVVTTNAAGNVTSVALTLTCVLRPGEWVTATATDPAGNTSEFSRAVRSALSLLFSVSADASLAGAVAAQAGTSNQRSIAPPSVRPNTDFDASVMAQAEAEAQAEAAGTTIDTASQTDAEAHSTDPWSLEVELEEQASLDSR